MLLNLRGDGAPLVATFLTAADARLLLATLATIILDADTSLS